MIGKLRRGGVIPAGVCPLPTITSRRADNYTHEAHRILDHHHPRGRLDRTLHLGQAPCHVHGAPAVKVHTSPPQPHHKKRTTQYRRPKHTILVKIS